jgi:NADPH:quinone reductase-like Zn-dependent oxidoreductase
VTRQADADIRQVTPPGAAGTAAVPIGRVYRFGQIVEAHTDMEQNRVSGKLVVTT